MNKDTTNGQPPAPGFEHSSAPQPINPKTGQHAAYWIMSELDRMKGFIRPYRDSYIHDACGVVTRMAYSIAETYARNPKFYTSTFCVGCKKHLPVAEFKWDKTDEIVGS